MAATRGRRALGRTRVFVRRGFAFAVGETRADRLARRVELSARVLVNGNAPTTRPMSAEEIARRPAYIRVPLPPDAPSLSTAARDVDYYELTRRILSREAINSGRLAEIGGSLGANSRAQFPNLEYVNLDLEHSDSIPTLVCDICADELDIEPEQFDVVFSHMAFEHFPRPWKAAENIIRLLRPGGIVLTATVFAWRYHPVPGDYWRFTPQALAVLFSDLETLDLGFVDNGRRTVSGGRYPNLSDAVPTDEHGGWLESWQVFHVGKKPLD
jgi:SAM-dependent methyltransferase